MSYFIYVWLQFFTIEFKFLFALTFYSLIRKSQSSNENFDAEDKYESEEDDRPESIDDKDRQKEMRKGIDLATTLERIEKNFVITDPRLPDNPIVRISTLLYLLLSSISHYMSFES